MYRGIYEYNFHFKMQIDNLFYYENTLKVSEV
jgi:hypothetical protein